MSQEAQGGLDRRTFFALCTASGFGGTVMPGLLWNRLQAQAPPPVPNQGPQQAPARITIEMVIGAEQVAGLQFSGAERDMMLQNLNSALQSLDQIRAVPLPNPVTPALIFQPLLPGRVPGIPDAKPVRRPARRVSRPAGNEDLAFLDVASLAELVRTRQVTATELTRLSLSRLKQYGPGLACVVNLTEERAVQQAEQADREIAAGKYRGPLHGIPWGAKDLLAVPGYPTTWGSPIYKDQVLDQTATVVERLDAAGAILVAKLSLGEFAQGDVWYGGTTKNPWNTEQGSSGSSAGPASATAAGLVPFAIGSETMGSIVSPSTRCGVTGLRPTFGRVSRHGAMALSWTMDKLGPMARSVEDCALVFSVIHGPDGKDPTVHAVPFPWNPALPLSGVRVGYLKSAFDAERPGKALDDAALEAMKGLGVPLVEVEMPRDLPVGALRMILTAEAAAAFDEITRTSKDDMMVRQMANAWPNSFRSARFIPAVEYIQANRIRTLLMERMEEVFKQVDVFVTPSFGGSVLQITNYTAHPAVVLPSGFTAEGTPVSVSFIGRPFGEAALCLVAQKWQEATGWHLKRPSGYA
jgi:Asp-tRNA(Asn)/Glu-tRNA(Gln) amidotransferase A subunit family amidase